MWFSNAKKLPDEWTEKTNKLKNNMPLYMYYRMQDIQIVELEYTNLKYTKTMSSIFNDNL
jgi:hypothetical protein